jgi:basic amino acid/polyamine antiporter, APA family
MIPAMFSIAELSSAMPRAAGTYFFIHRSLGPWVGTVGGFGDWLVLSFKSAFALVGMGAYITLFFDVPIVPVAVALTVAFGAINIVGARETAWLQKALVVTLVTIMAYYVTQGLVHLGGEGFAEVAERHFTPFMPFGTWGLVSTIGLVFISYAGLTKVAASAEEVRDLDRNLPLGMFLALGTVAAIYIGGVYVMVGILDPPALHDDLAPVATAGEFFLDWLPGQAGVILVVIAAIAAFASTGNAGILTASRYPLAMARDELIWSKFDRIGRFGTPTVGIIATCIVMIVSIIFLDVERLAKLGSGFLLLVFALINLSVIIMRESRIDAYVPGFRSPLYPWMQIVGVIAMLGLITTLGAFSIIFVITIVVFSSLWYVFYARGRVARRGAIYTLFRRLGRLGDPGIDLELWRLLQERGTSDEDSYEELVTRAHVSDLPDATTIGEVIDAVAPEVAGELRMEEAEVRALLGAAAESPVTPGSGVAAILEVLYPELDHPAITLVRTSRGVAIGPGREFPGQEDDANGDSESPTPTTEPGTRVRAIIVAFSPQERMTQHLRVLAELATQVDEPEFTRRWRAADDEQSLKEALLRHERFVSIELRSGSPASTFIGQRVRDIDWPQNTLLALIRREDQSVFPRGGTKLHEGDRITIIGPPEDVEKLFEAYARG